MAQPVAAAAPAWDTADQSDYGYDTGGGYTEDAAYEDDDFDEVEYEEEESNDDAYASLFTSDNRTVGHGIRNTVVVLLVLAVLGGLGYLGYQKVQQWGKGQSVLDYPGPGDADVLVTIPASPSSGLVANLLLQADVIQSVKAFTNAVDADPSSFAEIWAGTYKLKTKMKAMDALLALADHKNMVQEQLVAIPEGTRAGSVFKILSDKTGIPVADFEAVDPTTLGLPSWDTSNLVEGFLFPASYPYTGKDAATILKSMVKKFNEVAGKVQYGPTGDMDFATAADALGLSPMDALVLASIIQMEGFADATMNDMADVSQVFQNRLAQGMNLQSDATVAYANYLAGAPANSKLDFKIDSPYNTYTNTGLPPGAITNPGELAMKAAVDPTDGTYLYFVTVNPVTHETKFASTLDEHDQYVKEYAAWCKANNNPPPC